MKKIRPYYIGLVIDLLYIVIIISQWKQWFVGVTNFNESKRLLIIYICLAILYRISFFKLLSNRIITWHINDIIFIIKNRKPRVENGWIKRGMNVVGMFLYSFYKFAFLLLTIGLLSFYFPISYNNIFSLLITSLIISYAGASYIHFFILLFLDIYIDTVWVMFFGIIAFGIVLLFGVLNTSMWGLVTALVVIVNFYLSEDIWKITRYNIKNSNKIIYQKRFVRIRVLVNILVLVLFILLAILSPQSVIGKFLVSLFALPSIIVLGITKSYSLFVIFIIIYSNIEGITTFFVELLYKEDKTVEFYKKIKGKYQRVEKDIRGKDELTYSEPIVKIKNGKIYGLTYNQDKFFGYEIDLENKQIIFDDSSKLQFSFDDFNDELLIADKRYKKMKPTFNN